MALDLLSNNPSATNKLNVINADINGIIKEKNKVQHAPNVVYGRKSKNLQMQVKNVRK